MDENNISNHLTGHATKARGRMLWFTRLLWMVLFLVGTAYFAWLEWEDTSNSSKMVWFLLTGFWSMVCGIGYTVMHWVVASRPLRASNRR